MNGEGVGEAPDVNQIVNFGILEIASIAEIAVVALDAENPKPLPQRPQRNTEEIGETDPELTTG